MRVRGVDVFVAVRDAVGLALLPCLIVLGRNHHLHHAGYVREAMAAFAVALAVTLPISFLAHRWLAHRPDPAPSRPTWAPPVVRPVP